MIVEIDYNVNTRLGKINCESYIIEIIRNNFSQEKAGIHFIKKVKKHAPSRDYMVTPGGQFKIGLYKILISFIRHELNLSIKLTEEFKR